MVEQQHGRQRLAGPEGDDGDRVFAVDVHHNEIKPARKLAQVERPVEERSGLCVELVDLAAAARDGVGELLREDAAIAG